jgi:hypothetical protein
MSRTHIIAFLLVLLHFVLAAAFSIVNPLGEAPDEADHWAYVEYLANERRLPEGPKPTQGKHPPLYYATAAAIAATATPERFLRANPDVSLDPAPTQSPNFFIHTTYEAWPWRGDVLAFHLARFWSVLLSSATVAAVYGLARSALPARPGVALLATGIAATLPEFVFIGSAVTNDNAAALFGTLAVWGALAIYQASGDWRAGWWTPLALGLGMLSKASTLSLWPVVALAILLGAARPPAGESMSWQTLQLLRNWRRWLLSGVIVFLPALLIVSPWLLRNWHLYGDPSGMALIRQTIDQRTTPWTWADTHWLITGWFSTFWGKFGAVGHLEYPGWIYTLFLGLTLLGAVGLLIAWLRAPRSRPSILLLLLAVLTVALGMWRYSLVALGTDQGRLLFPAIGPILLLLALGLAAWPWSKARLWLGSGLVASLALITFYGLVGVIRPAFAPPPTPPAHTVERAVANDQRIVFGDLHLQGWALHDGIVLFWQAAQRPAEDWRVALRVTAEDGSLVWEWRRSPGYGRFSSDHWSVGTVVRDEYRVQWPDWADSGVYRVEVSLYPFDDDPGDEFPFVYLGWFGVYDD